MEKTYFKKLFLGVLCLGFIFGFGKITKSFAASEKEASESAPKLSIIMPIYNVENYLDEALNSAENQTLKDLEIICVNDGSTDKSLEILKRHAKKDKRIKIINQKNQGVSVARNIGIKASTAKYIHFFDADDMLAPYTMEKAVENLEKYDADLVKFKSVRFKHDSKIDFDEYSYNNMPVGVYDCTGDCDSFSIFSKNNAWEVWSQVYRKPLITENSIEFDKSITFGEDLIFNYVISQHMKKIVMDDNIGYFYRSGRPGSACNSPKTQQAKKELVEKYLIVIHGLNYSATGVRKEYHFKFLANYFLTYLYRVISALPQLEKNIYAKKIYKEVYTNCAADCNINMSANKKKKLADLKLWSKDLGQSKKSKKPTKAKAAKKVKTKSNKQRKSHSSRGKKNVTKRKNT